MQFRTKYERVVKHTNPGSGTAIVYSAEYNKNKQIEVVEKGKKDLYAEINSWSDSVNIHVLLARFMNGDKESLLQRAGAYIDISALPTNINEFIELSRNAENLFNSLPVEVKEKFNNNVVEFISTIGDEEWKDKMSVSPLEIQQEKNEQFKEANKARKGLGTKESVFGDQIVANPGTDAEVEINPITGNEVKK